MTGKRGDGIVIIHGNLSILVFEQLNRVTDTPSA